MKTIKLIVAILSLSVMYQFADAQNGCAGNRVRMSSGTKGHGCHCTSRCVDVSEVPAYQANYWYIGECARFCLIGWRSTDEVKSETETSLTEIYPNPASDFVTIEFALAQQGEVTLEVYDLTGRFVTVIKHDVFEAETNEVIWDASVLTQGIYFIKMKAGDYSGFKKISVVK